jgi:hypothetical protein
VAALFFVAVSVAALISLLPFLFPGSLLSALGAALNLSLADFIIHTLGLADSPLVEVVKPGQPPQVALTILGWLALFAPPLAVLGFVLRGK